MQQASHWILIGTHRLGASTCRSTGSAFTQCNTQQGWSQVRNRIPDVYTEPSHTDQPLALVRTSSSRFCPYYPIGRAGYNNSTKHGSYTHHPIPFAYYNIIVETVGILIGQIPPHSTASNSTSNQPSTTVSHPTTCKCQHHLHGKQHRQATPSDPSCHTPCNHPQATTPAATTAPLPI